MQLLHLNADSSWLLSHELGLSSNEGAAQHGQTFRILIDPWLSGEQVDFFPSFSVQSHGTTSPAFSTIAELINQVGAIDAVWVSHDFSDHCHRKTLLQIPPNVPIFANTKEAVSRVKSFRYFESVVEIPYWTDRAATDKSRWSTGGTVLASTLAREQHVDLGPKFPPLGKNCTLKNTQRSKFDLSRLHGIALLTLSGPSAHHTALFYAPHGMATESLSDFVARHGQHLEVVALLQSLDRVRNPWWLGGIIALGSPTALATTRLLKPRFLISTHDERDKRAAGLISHTLQREFHPPEEDLRRSLQGLDTQLRIVKCGDAVQLL